MPAGPSPWAFWNSSSVATEHTSLPAAGAAWAVSGEVRATLANIPGTTVHLHHPRIVASSSVASDGRGRPPAHWKTHGRADISLKAGHVRLGVGVTGPSVSLGSSERGRRRHP